MTTPLNSLKNGILVLFNSELEILNNAVENTSQKQVVVEQQFTAKNPAFQENMQNIQTLAFTISKKMQSTVTAQCDLTNKAIIAIKEAPNIKKVWEIFQPYYSELDPLTLEMKTMDEEFTYLINRLNILKMEINPPAWELQPNLTEKYRLQ